ncbi:hypothetical protein [Paenibacillus amylolyticus]|uniref:hypothetical protein n=1 Tax=Paenibacillus amylolyticus TaxID=1451 RepID=UPI003D807E6A
MSRPVYFEPEESMAYHSGEDVMHALMSIAGRYIGANPPHPPVYRVSRSGLVRKSDDHRYDFPLEDLFPDMQRGQQVYAWAKLWSDSDQEFVFHITCFGPVRLYHNGVLIYGSAPEEEYPAIPVLKLKCGLVRGWNHFVLEFKSGEKGEVASLALAHGRTNHFTSLCLRSNEMGKKAGSTASRWIFRCRKFLLAPCERRPLALTGCLGRKTPRRHRLMDSWHGCMD